MLRYLTIPLNLLWYDTTQFDSVAINQYETNVAQAYHKDVHDDIEKDYFIYQPNDFLINYNQWLLNVVWSHCNFCLLNWHINTSDRVRYFFLGLITQNVREPPFKDVAVT